MGKQVGNVVNCANGNCYREIAEILESFPL